MTWGTKLTRPRADTFAGLPATVERLLTGAPGVALPELPERIDRVAVVLLDAFGMRFVERHADHPLLGRLRMRRSRRSSRPPRPRTSRRCTRACRSARTGSTNGASTSRRWTP